MVRLHIGTVYGDRRDRVHPQSQDRDVLGLVGQQPIRTVQDAIIQMPSPISRLGPEHGRFGSSGRGEWDCRSGRRRKEDVGLKFLGKSSFGDLALLWVHRTGRDGVGTK